MALVDGFVHIVESPAPIDLLDGRTEGRVLSEALQLGGIPYSYSMTVDRNTLVEALSNRLVEAGRLHDGLAPIVHLSMHGDSNGIFLTDGEHLTWRQLRSLLSPLLKAMDGGLLVCMSSCFGSAGSRMAMTVEDEPPFWALVGNTKESTWADAAIAYACFYHLFFKGMPIDECVNSMMIASGDHNFKMCLGAEAKAEWVDLINKYIAMKDSLSAVASEVQAVDLGDDPSPAPNGSA